MTWRSIFLWFFLIAACNTPSPAFRGVTPTRITVDGSTFDVRVLKGRAEAMRVNAEYAPRFGAMRERAAMAMQEVSGCEVASVTGDQALAFGRLKCDGTPVPPLVVPVALECHKVRGSGIKELGQIRYDLDCDPD